MLQSLPCYKKSHPPFLKKLQLQSLYRFKNVTISKWGCNHFLVKKKLNLPSFKIATTITARNKISRTQNAAAMKKFNLRPKGQLQSLIR
jgi:hypothetical protein